MFIAKQENGSIVVQHFQEMFPNTSFPASGPNDDFFRENDCMKVSVFKAYDAATQMLEGCDPYIEEGVVYTVKVVAKPEPVVEESTTLPMDGASTLGSTLVTSPT